MVPNAGATVALEKTSISVREGDGSVLVCANVTRPDIPCPVAFEFNVTFSVRDITTGTPCYVLVQLVSSFLSFVFHFTCSAGSNDYSGVPATMTFSRCNQRKCVDVSVKNDAIVENTESFSIRLTRPSGLDSRITLTSTATVVEIMDNDSM